MYSRLGEFLVQMLIVVSVVTEALNTCSRHETCVNVRGCGLFRPHYHKPTDWSDDLKREFRDRVCARERTDTGIIYKVCCGANDTQKFGLELLDFPGCATKAGSRVARLAFSEDAALYEFGWMALVTVAYEDSRDTYCSGSLINDRYVLTVASIDPHYRNMYVRLGEHDRDSTIDCDKRDTLCATPPQDIAVERYIRHPGKRRFANDIGLLRLARKASFNDNVFPICLPAYSAPQSASESRTRTIQKSYYVVGWGMNENYQHNRMLQFVKVHVVPNDECSQRFHAMTRPTEILDTHICAIGWNVSKTCEADGGAPMIAFNRNGLYVQHGSLSFGPDGCGRVDAPDVFTRVESYIPWILDHLEE